MIDFKTYVAEDPTIQAVLVGVENILNIADELGAHSIEIYEPNNRPIFYFKTGDERIILAALSGDYFVKYTDGKYGTLAYETFGERWTPDGEALSALREKLMGKTLDGKYLR